MNLLGVYYRFVFEPGVPGDFYKFSIVHNERRRVIVGKPRKGIHAFVGAFEANGKRVGTLESTKPRRVARRLRLALARAWECRAWRSRIRERSQHLRRCLANKGQAFR